MKAVLALLLAVAVSAHAQPLMTPSQVDLKAGYCAAVLEVFPDPGKLEKVRGYLAGRHDRVDAQAVLIAHQQAKRDIQAALNKSPATDPVFAQTLRSCSSLDFLPY